MKNLLLASLSLLMMLCFGNTHAQQAYSLSGEIAGAGGEPLADANVYLLRLADSSIVKLALTEADGKFAFVDLQADSFLVAVKHLEHVPYTSAAIVLNAAHPQSTMPKVQLQAANETNLETVTLVSKLPLVERKLDRTIVNVDALITVAGGTALDALAKSPGVAVDEEGGIRLKGRGGVLVFIDDKPTYMSGSDLENYLRGLPASTIKQIELMPNPPAKYDAAGTGGVINIKTKKNNVQGFNGSLSLNYGQGRYRKTNNSFNFNYRYKKVNVFTTISPGNRVTYQDLYIDRTYLNPDASPQSFFGQRSYILRDQRNLNAKLGMDYYLSDKTTIGIVGNGAWMPGTNQTDNTAEVRDAGFGLSNIVVADNAEHNDFQNGSINLNLRHTFDSTGKSLTIDADYLGYRSTEDYAFQNFIFSPEWALQTQDRLDGTLNSAIQIFAFKADYSHPLKNGIQLSTGIKGSNSKTDNQVEFIRSANNVSAIDYNISNQFIYDEKIFAAYLNASREWNRFGAQLGLRAEATRSLGNQLGNPLQPATAFNREYNNLFPTVYLSYKLDSAGNHQFVLDYGKRINRPFFQDLNPFLSPLDKFTFYGGNPYLKPSFSHNLSLSHTFKNVLTTTVSYGRGSGEINETLEIVNGIYYSRPGNIGRSEVLNLAVDANIPLAKWWSLNIYGEGGRLSYLSKLYDQKLDASGYYCFVRGMNQFQFGKGWSGEVTAEYMSNFVAAQVTSGDFGFGSLGLKKNILHDKGSLRLSLSDVFYTRRFRGVINNLDQTTATFRSTVDSRVIAATFSYRFGKNVGDKPRHNGTSADSEKERVKG